MSETASKSVVCPLERAVFDDFRLRYSPVSSDYDFVAEKVLFFAQPKKPDSVVLAGAASPSLLRLRF